MRVWCQSNSCLLLFVIFNFTFWNQTWLAGKSLINGGLTRKITFLNSPFSSHGWWNRRVNPHKKSHSTILFLWFSYGFPMISWYPRQISGFYPPPVTFTVGGALPWRWGVHSSASSAAARSLRSMAPGPRCRCRMRCCGQMRQASFEETKGTWRVYPSTILIGGLEHFLFFDIFGIIIPSD